jgi:gas vesicle protein
MVECGEESREAMQLLKAAEMRETLRSKHQRWRQSSQPRGEQRYSRTAIHDQLATQLTYLLIGGGIGAILALLFAPKSGQELRGDIAEATRKGIDRSREAAQQLGERAGEYYEATRGRAAELYSQAAERVSEVAQNARDSARHQSAYCCYRRRQESLSRRKTKDRNVGPHRSVAQLRRKGQLDINLNVARRGRKP